MISLRGKTTAGISNKTFEKSFEIVGKRFFYKN